MDTPQDDFGTIRRSLESHLARISDLALHGAARVVAASAAPDLMGEAYGAILGGGDPLVGRKALKAALEAEGVPADAVNTIDSLYLACLVDPSMGV